MIACDGTVVKVFVGPVATLAAGSTNLIERRRLRLRFRELAKMAFLFLSRVT
jgi:hypothetical protein